ncbi:MAG TPA: hypothetical protein VIL49_11535 [Capillimicrobium sp.]
MPRELPIVFHKSHTRRYRSTLRRADGVVVELEGGSWNQIGPPAREVPHDLAHLVVEDELRLAHGVWGVLADGGLFRGASIAAGRQPPHAAKRARETMLAASEELNQAEVLTRAVCDLAIDRRADLGALRAATGPRWWSSTATEAAVRRAFERLQELGAAWSALAPGGTLDAAWPLRG